METVGYPSYFLFIALLIGMPMAFLKPFNGFLFITFLVTASDSTAFTFTRTQLLGPYFNANDVCLLIALAATLSYGVIFKYNICIPDVVKWIFVVLLVGFVQSIFFLSESTYEILRAMRWAVTLPLYFIFSATMVNEDKKVKLILIAIFLGSIVSSIQHIYYVRTHLEAFISFNYDIGQFRTLAFFNPGLWLLLSGIVWLPKVKESHRALIFIAGILFAVSVLLNQTRSIWISSIIVLPVALMVFRQKYYKEKAIILALFGVILFIGVSQIIYYLLKDIKVEDIVSQRIMVIFDREARFDAIISRQMSFKMEIEEWMNGSFIFGRGLSYFSSDAFKHYNVHEVAFGHMGHITTLAQLGLIGLFVYSFYFPLKIIQCSRYNWQFGNNEIKYLGLLAGICMIWNWTCFFMSNSFLGIHMTDAIIFGASYRQARMNKIVAIKYLE